MADNCLFNEEEMAIDEAVGYPQAYATLCRDRQAGLYTHGPPFTFTPYGLKKRETLAARELDQMFPMTNPKAKPTAKPKLFVSLLWKQLNHLGNAGFDPAVIRVDHYGNVLYYHADSASPLAWDIDHWFPCSRGGLTVPSNLRILQWQACKRKHHKLEFLVPWWDFQLGISVNQFLYIFASSNSDFRRRAFSFLFSEGENEELNASQTVESHSFPHHFVESKERLGFAPAAIVLSRKECYDSSSPLRSLDYNRQPRPSFPIVAARKVKPELLKENENPDFVTNPYQAIVMARDSLRQREERAKLKAEIEKVDDEVNDMRLNNEEDKVTIQDLELKLIKHRRKAEKCRRLAEAQSSYKTMLEKMIRDTMHQSVIYKEQLRLNQAASNALMARLEAQKTICNAAEKDLYHKYRQRDELEKQLRPGIEHVRKRSRIDDMLLLEETKCKTPAFYLPGVKPKTPTHKELRVFLEEEQRASESAFLSQDDGVQKQKESDVSMEKPAEHDKSIVPLGEGSILITQKLHNLEIEEPKKHDMLFPFMRESDGEEEEEDEESRKQRGKGNVEKWLQMLLLEENQDADLRNENESGTNKTHEISTEPNVNSPQKEKEVEASRATTEEQNKEKRRQKQQPVEEKNRIVGIEEGSKAEKEKNIDEECEKKNEQGGKERRLTRSDSARMFRRIPSSPSLILGKKKKGVDCIGKKPAVSGEDDVDGEDHAARNSFIKSSIKTLKKAVKI